MIPLPLTLVCFLVLVTNAQVPNPSPQKTLPQCQCIPNASGTGCMQYDSRLQAATLDEAMASFPDLSLERNETEPDAPLAVQASCTSKECTDCHEDLNNRLKKLGLLPTSPTDALLTPSNRNSTCRKYKFSQKEEGVYDDDDDDNDSGERKRSSGGDDSDSDDSDEDDDEEEEEHAKKQYKKGSKKSKEGHRHRRQAMVAVGSQVTIVGQRFTMSCSAKGVATDSAGLVPLCSTCWVWRQLPSNYEPQYINELVCDGKDSACLSGYASCGAGYHSVEVVRTDGNIRTTVSISAASYCECKISRSSALLGLVTGNSTSGVPSLPAA